MTDQRSDYTELHLAEAVSLSAVTYMGWRVCHETGRSTMRRKGKARILKQGRSNGAHGEKGGFSLGGTGPARGKVDRRGGEENYVKMPYYYFAY